MKAEEIVKKFSEKQRLATLQEYQAVAIGWQCIDADYLDVCLYASPSFGVSGAIRLNGNLTEVQRLLDSWSPLPVYKYDHSFSTACQFKELPTMEGAVEIAPFILLSYVDQLVFRFWVQIDATNVLKGIGVPESVACLVAPFTMSVEVPFDVNLPLPITIEHRQNWASSIHISTLYWSKQTKFSDILST